MTVPNYAVIIGIPAYLHDALRHTTQHVVEVGGLLGSVNAAYSDTVQSYGRLIDAVARYVNESEANRESLKEAQAFISDMARERIGRDAEGVAWGTPVDRDPESPAEVPSGRPVG